MQQVNLYLPEFRSKTDLLSAERALLLLGTLLVVLISLQVIKVRELSSAEASAVNLEAEQLTLKQNADALKKAPRPLKDASLQQEVERLREAIRNREGVAGIIASRSLGNETGFSSHLVALGRHRVDGVVLQEFSLDSGGAYLRLQGLSEKPEFVPLYLSQLQNDEKFKSTKFGYLSLRNMGANVEFLLSGDGPMDPGTLSFFTEEQLVPR